MRDMASRGRLLKELRHKMRAVTGQLANRNAADQTPVREKNPFDALLPPGYESRGTLIEWLSEGAGHGALWLAFKLAAERLQKTGVLVAVDPLREFYPPVVASLGVPLDRFILLRPRSQPDVLWGLEQSLRCPGVAAVVCALGKIDPRASRRLQLAVETGGGVGMLVRPTHYGGPSWADVRMKVSALSGVVEGNLPEGRRLRVEVLHCRAGTPGAAVDLELSDDPVCVRLVSQLAPAAAVRRASGA